MSPDEGTTAWPCSTKNSSNTFRSWLASINPGPLLIRTSVPGRIHTEEPAMDGRHPGGVNARASGADPALPVGGSHMSEPQDGASESKIGPRFELVAEDLFVFPHALAALSHGRPEVGTELLQRRAEVGRDPLGA